MRNPTPAFHLPHLTYVETAERFESSQLEALSPLRNGFYYFDDNNFCHYKFLDFSHRAVSGSFNATDIIKPAEAHFNTLKEEKRIAAINEIKRIVTETFERKFLNHKILFVNKTEDYDPKKITQAEELKLKNKENARKEEQKFIENRKSLLGNNSGQAKSEIENALEGMKSQRKIISDPENQLIKYVFVSSDGCISHIADNRWVPYALPVGRNHKTLGKELALKFDKKTVPIRDAILKDLQKVKTSQVVDTYRPESVHNGTQLNDTHSHIEFSEQEREEEKFAPSFSSVRLAQSLSQWPDPPSSNTVLQQVESDGTQSELPQHWNLYFKFACGKNPFEGYTAKRLIEECIKPLYIKDPDYTASLVRIFNEVKTEIKSAGSEFRKKDLEALRQGLIVEIRQYITANEHDEKDGYKRLIEKLTEKAKSLETGVIAVFMWRVLGLLAALLLLCTGTFPLCIPLIDQFRHTFFFYNSDGIRYSESLQEILSWRQQQEGEKPLSNNKSHSGSSRLKSKSSGEHQGHHDTMFKSSEKSDGRKPHVFAAVPR